MARGPGVNLVLPPRGGLVEGVRGARRKENSRERPDWIDPVRSLWQVLTLFRASVTLWPDR